MPEDNLSKNNLSQSANKLIAENLSTVPAQEESLNSLFRRTCKWVVHACTLFVILSYLGIITGFVLILIDYRYGYR